MNKGELLQRARNACAAGDFRTGSEICRQILSLSPLNAEATLLLANICAHEGKTDAAYGHLQALLRREPSSPEVHLALATLLFQMGMTGDARSHAHKAIELRPDDPAIHAASAFALAGASFFDEAQVVLTGAIDTHANSVTFLRGLADRMAQGKAFVEAVQVLEQLVKTEPSVVQNWIVLGRIRGALGNLDGAFEAGLQAVRLNGRSAEAHMMVALALENLKREAEAIPYFERVLELKPTDYIALTTLGVIQQHLGNFEAADAYLARAIHDCPTNGFAQYARARSTPAGQAKAPALAKLADLARSSKASEIDKVYLHFAAAKGWEDLGEFERAMEALDAGNAANSEYWLKGGRWPRKPDQDYFSKLLLFFSREEIERLQPQGFDNERPVFVVGMPRSGTSLVEQILSSHPDIFGGGEIPFWNETIQEILAPLGDRVDEKALAELGQVYLAHLSAVNSHAKRFINKYPQSFVYLGVLSAVFPKAKFIHVRRNPIDTAFSIYSTPFGHPPIFAHSQEDIVFMYREYMRLMEGWRKALKPNDLFEVDYESVVSDPEHAARAMIEFLELPWDSACLKHEANSKSVNTASVWQVRQPIYDSSIGRWRKFEPWIGEFIELGSNFNPDIA